MQLRKFQYILVLTYDLRLTTYDSQLTTIFYPMGRYRPPQAKGSCYITRQGYDRLIEELDFLWHKRRPEVIKALTAAAAEGDRSENAEYIYRKKELGEIDRRSAYLSKRVDELKVVELQPNDTSKVYFGAWVELENDEGDRVQYRIVGPDEIDASSGYISMDSPVAKALMKRSQGDDIQVATPGGKINYSIVDVRYTPFNQGTSD